MFVTVRPSRFRMNPTVVAGFILAAVTACTALARAQGAVRLTPAVVETGSPVLISVTVPRGTWPDGEWLDRKLQFFRGRGSQAWYALAGVDVEAAVGPSTMSISAHTRPGGAIDLSRTVEIHPASYKTEALSVAPNFVEPGPEDLKRVAAESEIKKKIFAASAPRPLWSGNFRAPVHAAPTGNFGARRTFNGQLDSIHRGLDFRARKGTPVRAANSGVVVLAAPLYYEGNCVVIDHGLGLFTLSMHLSRISVHEGQRIVKGQRIGLSGATGRTTGPHLHWAVRWQGAYLDPAKLLRLDLTNAH